VSDERFVVSLGRHRRRGAAKWVSSEGGKAVGASMSHAALESSLSVNKPVRVQHVTGHLSFALLCGKRAQFVVRNHYSVA